MRPIRTFICFFLIILGSNSVNASGHFSKFLLTNTLPKDNLSDIAVGQRTTDSTGQLSISNSGIQQSVISAIALLDNKTITSDNSSLLVFQNTAYLTFHVTDTAGVKSYIALQLDENSSGDFVFHAGYGKELHILTNSANCSSCIFLKEQGGIAVTNCSGGSPCKHQIHFSMQ